MNQFYYTDWQFVACFHWHICIWD